MAEATFRAPVRSSGRGGGHLVDVPPQVIEELGGQGSGRSRIPVTATFDGVPYRGSIVRMGGGAVLGVQKAIMAEAGVSVGDTLTVVVRNDDAPREVEVPVDLAEALRGNDEARAVFEGLSYSHRREYVGSITEAKRPETRARRVERTIQAMLERASRG
jgi:antitoxin component of MazEF toxin-antitoxin module